MYFSQSNYIYHLLFYSLFLLGILLKSLSSLLFSREIKLEQKFINFFYFLLIQLGLQETFLFILKFSKRAHLPILALQYKMGPNFHTKVKSYLQLIFFKLFTRFLVQVIFVSYVSYIFIIIGEY